MKLIQNTGTQRVIDLMQPHLKHETDSTVKRLRSLSTPLQKSGRRCLLWIEFN